MPADGIINSTRTETDVKRGQRGDPGQVLLARLQSHTNNDNKLLYIALKCT